MELEASLPEAEAEDHQQSILHSEFTMGITIYWVSSKMFIITLGRMLTLHALNFFSMMSSFFRSSSRSGLSLCGNGGILTPATGC